jgi:sarcosine oxidase
MASRGGLPPRSGPEADADSWRGDNLINRFDTIVLGLGATGSATAYQLAKRGNRVLGLDQFEPPHTYGSTHGETRITRQAIGEGIEYTPLALRSYELWREIERETGKDLLTVTGGLIISSTGNRATSHVANFFENTLSAARHYGIRHDVLDATGLRRCFPQFSVEDDEVGYYEHQAGFLRPENCVAAQLFLAEQHGAEIHRHERVEEFTPSNGAIRVRSRSHEYEATRLVVSAGPWLPTLLEQKYSKVFTIFRQVQIWLEVKGSIDRFLPGTFPVFIWELQNSKQGVYGFPALNGPNGGLKVATEQYDRSTTADSVKREVSHEEVQAIYELVARRLPDLAGNGLKAISCLYTTTPDAGFVIDSHPKYPAIILASPCSGHGFKHSAAIGEAITEIIIDGTSTLDLSRFRIARFVGA